MHASLSMRGVAAAALVTLAVSIRRGTESKRARM